MALSSPQIFHTGGLGNLSAFVVLVYSERNITEAVLVMTNLHAQNSTYEVSK